MIGGRRKRRSEIKPAGRLALMGLLVIALAVGTVAFGVRSVTGVPGADYQTFYAELPDIGNLRPHDEVRVAGVRVGQVLDQETKGGRAVVEIQLLPDTGRLPADSTLAVRARGLLGSRYLELRPGRSSRLMEEGATIRAGERALTNGVADVLDTFDAETRGRFGDMLGGFGQGLAGRGRELNSMIEVAPGVTEQLDRITRSVMAREGAARALVPSLESGMGAFDAAREDIAPGFGVAADGLQPFEEAREDARDTLTEAPPALGAMQSGLGTGRRLLASTQSLAKALNRTLPGAPRALRGTTLMLRESPTPLRRTASLLRTARPTVPAVLQITRALSPNLVPLRRAFDDLKPIVGHLGDHGCDITNFADNWRSVLGYGAPSSRDIPGGDAGNYNQFRINVIANAASLGNVAGESVRPFITDRDVYAAPCKYSPGPTYSADGLDFDTLRGGP